MSQTLASLAGFVIQTILPDPHRTKNTPPRNYKVLSADDTYVTLQELYRSLPNKRNRWEYSNLKNRVRANVLDVLYVFPESAPMNFAPLLSWNNGTFDHVKNSAPRTKSAKSVGTPDAPALIDRTYESECALADSFADLAQRTAAPYFKLGDSALALGSTIALAFIARTKSESTKSAPRTK